MKDHLIDYLPPRIILGRQTETGVNAVRIDCSAWLGKWPELELSVWVTPPGGNAAYPAVTHMEGTVLVWPITSSDTAHEGFGSAEIMGTAAGLKKLSAITETLIQHTSIEATSDPPTPAQPWVDAVMNAAKRAEEAADRAESAGGSGSGGPGGITQESDPTVPAWAKEPTKPTYTAEEVGAQPTGNYALKDEIPTVPVQSVNGKTGSVQLTASDVGAASAEDVERLSEELFEQRDVDELVVVPVSDIIVEPEKFAQIGMPKPITAFASCDLWRIPVTVGQKHYITNVYRAAAVLYCYVDENDNALEAYPEEAASTKEEVVDYEVTAPEGAAYLLVNYMGRWQKYETVVKTTAATKEKAFKAEELVGQYIYNPLYGKKLVFCGDSITEARNPDGGFFEAYGEVVAKRNGMTCVKDGIGGSTMTNVEGHAPFSASRYLAHTDFDYLTIWFGWNDGAYAELGTIDDTDDTTFYGAYKKVLTHYMTTYPTKKLGLVVPYGFRTAIQQAVRDISELFGVPCLDLADGKQCSTIWGDDNDAQIARRAALTYDTTHPNQAGHDFIATMYEHFLRSL